MAPGATPSTQSTLLESGAAIVLDQWDQIRSDSHDTTFDHHWRTTRETDIKLSLNLDGSGMSEIQTGIGFLDHMLTALARHGRFDLQLLRWRSGCRRSPHQRRLCDGDRSSHRYHSWSDRSGIQRFGFAYVPMDEALARVVVDLSGRPASVVSLGLRRERIGNMATENITHVFQSLAIAMRASLHVDCLRGENDHHRAEAAFKACALALRTAISTTPEMMDPKHEGLL